VLNHSLRHQPDLAISPCLTSRVQPTLDQALAIRSMDLFDEGDAALSHAAIGWFDWNMERDTQVCWLRSAQILCFVRRATAAGGRAVAAMG
jgi:hypothetical protein